MSAEKLLHRHADRMTIPIAIVLSLLVLAILLFITEKLSVDVITLILLIALVTSGILSPGEAFAGFSSDIIIILGSIFVISGALHETGVLDMLGAKITKLGSASMTRLSFLMMVTSGGVSAFMNNTTVTAMMVPPVIGIAKRAKLNASKLLMPLAYASMLGGTCTLIGTSTNVAVSGYIARSGMEPLGLFEITPIGLIIVVVGITYMLLIGQRLLPDTKEDSLAREYGIRQYLSEIIVMPHSPLIGQRAYESDMSILEFRILKIIRGPEELLPSSRVFIEENDTLLIEGKVENLMKVKKIEGIEIKPELELGDKDLRSSEFEIAEVLITPQSDLVGRSLKQSEFRQRLGLTVLAIYRHGRSMRETMGDALLRVGDLLLVQGPATRVDSLRRDPTLAILDEHAQPRYDRKRGLFTVAFFVAAITAGGLGWLDLSVAFLSAAVMTVLTRCITPEGAYNFIDWRLLILIGGMTAFGSAMEKTGTAPFVGHLIVSALGAAGPMAIMAGFFVMTIALTQTMSNAAAALVVLPVAISTAAQLGVNERTFAISIMLAASISFIAPFEPSCVLVYGPGKYRFMDFVRTGIGLTALLMVVVLLLIPVFWPLH